MGSPVAADTAAPTQQPEDEETKAARAAGEKAFLKLDDFPTGWTLAPSTTVTPQELELPSECQSPVLSRKQPPDSVVQVDSPEFVNASGQQAGSRVIVFRDEGTAKEYVDGVNEFIDTFDRCRQPLLEALRKNAGELTGGAPGSPTPETQTTDLKVERLSLGPLGDQFVAPRLTISVESDGVALSLQSDLLTVRVGRIVSLLGYLSTTLASPDLSEEGRLAGIVADRLKDAAKELD
jgi:hypothetical protein